MKQLRSKVIVLIAAVVLLGALIPCALAPANAGSMGITTAGGVKFRRTPSTDAPYWFTLPINFQAEVKEVRHITGVTWYKLAIKKPDDPNSHIYTGWVHGDFFRYIDDAEPAAPKTGDENSLTLLMMLLLVSGGAILLMSARGSKRY